MLLASTSDLVRIITAQAVDVDVAAEYADLTSDGIVSAGRLLTKITTATTTTIVGSPAASTVRKVKELQIQNVHASSSVGLTIIQTDGTNTINLETVTLLAGERIGYREATGYTLIGADGVDKPSGAGTFLMRAISADAAGQNVATAQPWFPATGAVAVAAGTSYLVDGLLAMTRTAGTTSHTTSLLFGGTATLTSIQLWAECNTGDVDTSIVTNRTMMRAATAAVVKAASTSATEAVTVMIRGIVRINAAGTFIPQFQYSAAPGGAPTVKADSFFRLVPVGSNNFTAQGVWT